MKYFLIIASFGWATLGHTQQLPFEKSNGSESATYAQTIALYEQMAKASPLVSIKNMGPTDAGLPLHLVLVSGDGNANPANWHSQQKIVIMVNNGIHPGEPDGIDASLMLVRDIVTGKKILPTNVAIGIVPVYNIGGSLNRGPYSRANQNGPLEYGFRGNAQNLDLNRDFTKADSYNARSFAKAFHFLNPHILIDNHVSDGADFQHVFTLLTTQYNKLDAKLGEWLRTAFEPALYQGMAQKGWNIFPYVNFDSYDLSRGMTQFYDPPRYSSGYAALFQTIGFVPETHMLKPYDQRVKSTYDFMNTVIQQASAMAPALQQQRKAAQAALLAAKEWPLAWSPNRSRHDSLTFLGYERDTITSPVTGLPAMQYNRNKPFSGSVKFYSYFDPAQIVAVPKYYVIQQGWHEVIDRLKENNIAMIPMARDTAFEVTVSRIESYKTSQRSFEKHYRQTEIKTTQSKQKLTFRKGDLLIPVQQPGKRYLLEMLTPAGEDGFFSWNYFDAILQQKEGYSNYRWETVAEAWLNANPALRAQLAEKKKTDPEFAKNSSAILNWVYKNSPYYEPSHMRHPVFSIQ